MGVAMLRLLLLTIGAGTAALCAAADDAKPVERNAKPALVEFHDAKHGFKFKHPADWEKEKSETDIAPATFTAKQPDDDDPVLDALMIGYYPNADPNVKHVMDGLKENMERDFGRLTLLEPASDTKLGGKAARKMMLDGKKGVTPIRFVEIMTLAHGAIYQINISTTPKRYQRMQPTIAAIIESFSFDDPDDTPDSSKMLTYEDRRGQFKINYPPRWEVRIDPTPILQVAFLSNERPPNGRVYQDSIQVAREEGRSDLAAIIADSKEYHRVHDTDYKLLHDDPMTLGGRLGRRMIFTKKDQDEPIEVAEYHVIVDNTLWTLFMSAGEERFENLWGTFNAAARSFKLAKAK